MLRSAPFAALSFIFLAAATSLVRAQGSGQDGVRGDWRTPKGAVIRIAPCGPDLCATVLKLSADAPGRFDTQNPDAKLHTRKLCGLQIGYGFHQTDSTHAEDGHLYDPESGKTYKGAMSSSGDQLTLRGYIGIKAFGRSETWTRTTAPTTPCS